MVRLIQSALDPTQNLANSAENRWITSISTTNSPRCDSIDLEISFAIARHCTSRITLAGGNASRINVTSTSHSIGHRVNPAVYGAACRSGYNWDFGFLQNVRLVKSFVFGDSPARNEDFCIVWAFIRARLRQTGWLDVFIENNGLCRL